jgi:hypothetical protein
MSDPISRLEVCQREIDRVFGDGHAAAQPTAGRRRPGSRVKRLGGGPSGRRDRARGYCLGRARGAHRASARAAAAAAVNRRR